jgi:hypothetical protein
LTRRRRIEEESTMTNVRHLTPKSGPPAMTIENAKRVQELVEHLNSVRAHRVFLANKLVTASSVHLTVHLPAHVIPPDRRGDGGFEYKGQHYHRRSGGDWTVQDTLKALPQDPREGELSKWECRGAISTLGTRVMDGVRAAVADEIEATEKAITDLGFMVPPEVP